MRTLKIQWWCPAHGLEHRCLSVQGWKEERFLVVRDEMWVLMVRP